MAAFGDAVNGTLIFGPLGLIIGWLIAPRTPTQDPTHLAGAQPSNVGQIKASIAEMRSPVARLLAAIWNLEMLLFIAVGLMPFVQRYPWSLVALAILLLAVAFPLGVIFTVTGLVALHFNVTANAQFIVDLRKDAA